MVAWMDAWREIAAGLTFAMLLPGSGGLAAAGERSGAPALTSVALSARLATASQGGELSAALAERAARLDRLHARLREADDERQGQAVAVQIWDVWLSHPDARIDGLMKQVLAAREAQRFDAAIDLLDQLVATAPDYAEAWNQRATLRYLMGDLEGSLEDIAETLAREPRHFGALSGRGMVRLQQGKQALAWQSFEAARKVHPWIASRLLVPPQAREIPT